MLSRRRVWLSSVGVLTLSVPLSAQRLTQRSAQQRPTQAVMLRIGPHVGDTLRMKMEQHVAMSDVPDDANARNATHTGTMVASMRVCTCAIVQSASATGTDLVSYTDSVSITPAAAASLPVFSQAKHALEGKAVRLHVSPDGGITVNGSAGKAASAVTQMPPMLPDKAVAPGDVWMRDLQVPVSATHASSGTVRVTFRLDSLAPDGTIAFVSMQGTFSHSHPATTRNTTRNTTGKADKDSTPHDQTSGTISGMMQIDRRLEWMTDSYMTVTLLSTVPSSSAGPPTHVRMKITQSMRALPRK